MSDEIKATNVVDKDKLWNILGEKPLTLIEIAGELGLGDRKLSKTSLIAHLSKTSDNKDDGEGFLLRLRNIKQLAIGGGNQKPATYRKTGLNIPNWLLKEKKATPAIGQKYDFEVSSDGVFTLTPK